MTVYHKLSKISRYRIPSQLTDVAPDWSNVDDVVPPYEDVDSLEETLSPDPEDVKDASNVPCCKNGVSPVLV